ncbi:MAG: hypothetical protein Q8K02_10465 [Flavobacterium sp.]|nr:hypothetical protein [Flavobacterium sp.]
MILGEFKRELSTQKLPSVPCQSCGEEQLQVTVISKFFVLGLPVFPTGKQIDVSCKNCKKHNIINYKTQRSAADRIQRIANEAKHKWYSYLLLIIIGLGFPYVLITKSDEFKQEMGLEPKTVTPLYHYSNEPDEEAEGDIVIEAAPISETAERKYLQLTYSTSTEPEHPAANYLLTLFNTEIKSNSHKSFELEATDNGSSLILVCYVPNIRNSSTKAKEELLSRSVTALKKKFGYKKVYLAFYGYDTNLYALRAGEYSRVSGYNLDSGEEILLHDFYDE